MQRTNIVWWLRWMLGGLAVVITIAVHSTWWIASIAIALYLIGCTIIIRHIACRIREERKFALRQPAAPRDWMGRPLPKNEPK
jgi:hypothetical protein